MVYGLFRRNCLTNRKQHRNTPAGNRRISYGSHLDKTEQKIVDIIDAHRNEIIAFAKDIYTHAELGYKEYRTAEKFASFMKIWVLRQRKDWLSPVSKPT